VSPIVSPPWDVHSPSSSPAVLVVSLTDAHSYGAPALLIDEDWAQVWTTPVTLLDQLFLACLVMHRVDARRVHEPGGHPTVALSALPPDGVWVPCSYAGGGGGGGPEVVQYATFSRPSAEAFSKVRLDVQYRGTLISREMFTNP